MKAKLFGLIGVLVVLAVVGAVAWWGMSFVSPNWARLWALLATVALPGVACGAWWFGHIEAKGRLAGIDQAVDKVMRAATGAAGLTVQGARAMRPPSTVIRAQAPQVILPDLEIIPRQLSSGGGEVEL